MKRLFERVKKIIRLDNKVKYNLLLFLIVLKASQGLYYTGLFGKDLNHSLDF